MEFKKKNHLETREKNKMTPLSTSFIDVAVALPVPGVFTYEAPETLLPFVETGKRALVPFGGRTVTGYILGWTKKKTKAGLRIKPIFDIPDASPLFPGSMTPFFKWISDYYMHPLGEVIKSALPGGLTRNDYVEVGITPSGEKIYQSPGASPLERRVFQSLSQTPAKLGRLLKTAGKDVPKALIYAMEKKGWVTVERTIKKEGIRPKMERFAALAPGHEEATATAPERLSESKKKILTALSEKGETSVRELKQTVKTAASLIKSLEKEGRVVISEKRVYRDPMGEDVPPDAGLPLTGEQETAVRRIISSLDSGFSTHLLNGVTGSGKTEVYMRLTEQALSMGRNVLVLVPEIALISQTERMFRARFGNRIALLHSGLTPGQRYDEWGRILKKKAQVAIGARSAIFAPFESLGMIIVDEEHESSYKQDSGLRYNARDLAVVRAKLENASAVLGSATPSIQSHYNMTQKKYKDVRLEHRIHKRPLPDISMVDLRQTRDMRGIGRFISPELRKGMEEALNRKEQVLLFLNRRGFAGFPVCGKCGKSVRCVCCDISLTLHKAENAYKCHYCDFSIPSSSPCRFCGSPGIKNLGLGTEKVEEAVKKLFPQSRVVRMDRDTTQKRGSLLKILKDLRNNETDILIGTQMVAKGHDFPNITLVGILCADLSLNFPDFRAGEITFQLISQVAGRAGRGAAPGRVILQTYNPDHFTMLSAKNKDYHQFYQREIAFRKSLGYPPFSKMVLLMISGLDPKKTETAARDIGVFLKNGCLSEPAFQASIEILGPVKAPLFKIANRLRWQILLKSPDAKKLRLFTKRLAMGNDPAMKNRHVKISVDVDPVFML